MNVKVVGDKRVVYLHGEINVTTGTMMKEKISELFNESNIIVLSFKEVVYMNSSGLRDIIEAFKNGQKQQKQLILCEMPADIKEMFMFTGLGKVFQIFDTEAEALG